MTLLAARRAAKERISAVLSERKVRRRNDNN